LKGLAAGQDSSRIELALIGERRSLRNGDGVRRYDRKENPGDERNKTIVLHVQHLSKPLKKITSRPVVGAAGQNPAMTYSVVPLE
jgi:hypothetical protein